MSMWLGTPVVFALAAALIFAVLYLLFPEMHVNAFTALLMAAAAFGLCLIYHYTMRRKMCHAYEADINKDEVIIYKDGKEINLGKAVYATVQESEESGYKKAVLYILAQKHILLTAYGKKTFYGLGSEDDVYQMEMAYFELKKYLPEAEADRARRNTAEKKKGKKK